MIARMTTPLFRRAVAGHARNALAGAAAAARPAPAVFAATASPRPSCLSSFAYGGGAGGASGHQMSGITPMRATTIVSVRKKGQVAIVGDGQVTAGSCIVKGKARKVRTLADGAVISGMAGSTADCLTLLERLEGSLEKYPGQIMRACVELAKAWRTDRYLRRLEAVIVVSDASTTLWLNGAGDVMEPEDGIVAVGSGGNYALAAARALADRDDLDAAEVATRAMTIAAARRFLCVLILLLREEFFYH